MYDIVIVGGGPAGMTAAIYGLRAGKTVMLIEGNSFGGQITLSSQVENYPGISSMTGNEFATTLMEQIVNFGVELNFTIVTGIREETDYKVVVTEDGEILCKTVILATGVRHRMLGIPREEELVGSGISYCAVCDGAFFKGKDVAVIGGGNTALQDAEFLSTYCNNVYLIHRRDEFRGEQHLVKRIKEKENITVIIDSVVTEFMGNDTVEGIKVHNKKSGKNRELNVTGVFIAVGQVPNNEAFADIVELDEERYIKASEECKTSAEGIFAAGDCRGKEIRQLTTAVADGAVAAMEAVRFMIE